MQDRHLAPHHVMMCSAALRLPCQVSVPLARRLGVAQTSTMRDMHLQCKEREHCSFELTNEKVMQSAQLQDAH